MVRWTHEKAATTTTLSVELVERSSDVESTMLTYIYRWYLDGELYEHATSDTLPSYETSKGENWTVEVTAFDGEDESLPCILSMVIANAPPVAVAPLPDPELEEDTTDDQWLNLTGAFDDADGDRLVWSVAGLSDNLTITIDPATGIVTIEPAPNWHGEEAVTFVASDGELTASQTVTVHVTSVNDIPTIETVDGEPVTADTIEYTIMQGETLVIRYTVADEDGDEVLATVTSLAVEHDEVARTITYAADDDEVGTITFTLSISDVISVSDKVTIDFVINVKDRNDPMGDPHITSPEPGATFKANNSFMLASACDDPDVPLGQVLNYTWESDISGLLGFGPSLMVSIAEAGTHVITVTVRDPDFSASATITVVIEPRDDVTPPPPPDNGNDPVGSNWGLVAVIIAVLVIVGAVLVLLSDKRRAGAPEDLVDASEERTAPQLTHDTIDGPADEWEADGEEWVETFEEM